MSVFNSVAPVHLKGFANLPNFFEIFPVDRACPPWTTLKETRIKRERERETESEMDDVHE